MASRIHGGHCGPCSLCHKDSTRYSHAINLQDQVYNFLCSIEGKSIVKEACICHACIKQIQRNIGNPTYHPRWRPKKEKTCTCSVEKCGVEVYRNTNLATPSEVSSVLHTRVTTFTVDDTDSTVPLCKKHYTELYSILRAPSTQCCEACGAKPKGKTKFVRRCQSPELANAYLSLLCNEQSKLSTTSTICSACYKFFLRITAQMEQAQSVLGLVNMPDDQQNRKFRQYQK